MDSLGKIILYVIVAIAIVAFSVMAVTTRRILRAATYLLFVLISTAVFYFQLGYEFLGGVQIAVYAGGILVLFVFSILLTQQPGKETPRLDSHRKACGLIASLAGVGVLLFALLKMFSGAGMGRVLTDMAGAPLEVNMQTIGNALLGTEKFQYLLPFEAVSVLLLACIIGGVVIARKRQGEQI